MITRYLLVFTIALLASPPLFAQALTPEEFEAKDVRNMAKSEARSLFFLNRVASPDGSVPRGARIKAYDRAMQSLAEAPLHKGAAVVDMPWTNIGPYNIGGRIKALAINPQNPQTVFAGAAGGGIWRSYDEGASWHSVSDLLPTQAMGALVINPIDTAIVYAGTGEASFGGHSFDGAGMFKSTDGGSTWARSGEGQLPDYGRISMMAINPQNPDIVYASVAAGARDADDLGIWRTTDAGANWTHIFTTTTTDVVINPQNPDILYTVGTKIFGTGFAPIYGFHKTTDGGDTWTKLDIGVVDSLIGRTGLAISASNPDVLYASVSEVTGGRTPLLGIFKTIDGGATWEKKEVPFDYMIPQGWFDNVMGVNPANPDIVYAGAVKCLRSDDGGATWTRVHDQLGGGLLHVDQHAIAFNPQNPDRVFIGNDGGLFLVTDNGETLEKRDIGMSITQFIGGDFHPTDSRFLFGGTQDNGTMRSPDAGGFELVLYGDGGYGYVNPLTPNVVWTTQEVGKLFRSEDHGQTWYRVVGDMPNDGSLFYTPYDMDKNNPSTLYIGTYRVYKTTDEGAKWRRLQSGLFPTATGSYYYITALGIAGYNSDNIMAGGPLGAVAVSTNAGEDWTQVGESLPDGYVASVRSFADGELYVAMSTYEVDKVFMSTNFGQDWTNITGDLPDIPAKDIYKIENTLFLGTDLGVFVSENGGTNWLLMTNGMATVPVERFYWNEQMQILRAYTHGRGLFDLQWSEPPGQAPVFASTPNTDMLEFGEVFSYAPVVNAWPMPTYSLEAGPSTATIDPVLGTVRWSGSDMMAQFTIKAENSVGSATQQFTLTTNDAPLTEWDVVSPQPMPTAVNVMRYAGNNTLWVGRDSGWVSKSEDGGSSWTHSKIIDNDVSIIGMHAFDAQRAIMGTGGPQALVNTGVGHLLKTTDGGQSWREVLYGINSRFGNMHFWNDNDGVLVSQGANDSADVWLTSDAGETWQKQSERHFAATPLYNTLRFFDRNTGYYASAESDGYTRILRTTDGGATWDGSRIIPRYVSELAMYSADRGFLVDEFTRLLYRTSNGTIWAPYSPPMKGMRNVSVDVDPQGRYLWVVNDSSAWTSNNDGSTWHKSTLVYTGPMLDAVFADSLRGWAISKKGIVQSLRRNPAVSAIRTVEAAPRGLQLLESYPNPVASGSDAVLAFSLERGAQVTLKIFGSSGKQIATVVESPLRPGEHYTVWNTAGMAPGVYFYTVTAGTQQATGRIAVIQ